MTTRRQFLGAISAAALTAQSATPGASIRYRTGADRIRSALPPPLEPAEPLVQLEYGPSASRVLVQARHGDVVGWFPVGAWVTGDGERWKAREGLGLPDSSGRVELGANRAALMVGGETLHEVRFTTSEQQTAVESPTRLFTYDYRLNPNWLGDTIERPTVGFGVVERSEAPGAARNLEPTEITPPAAFPLEDLVGAWSGPLPAAESYHERERIASEQFSPFAFGRYGGIEPYDHPAELVLDPVEIVEVNAYVSPETHFALLPPPCRAFSRPQIKLLGVRAHKSDLSRRRFTEVWLLASCVAGRKAGWYAVSHISSEGGDLSWGRETLGYPTKSGDPDLFVSPVDFQLTCQRNGREIAFADGGFSGFSTGTSLMQMSLFGLQADRSNRTGRLIHQQWHYQGLKRRPHRATLRLELAASQEGQLDRWDQVGPIQPVAGAAYESAVMQRSPGQVVAEVPDAWDYYRDRSDGALPWRDSSEVSRS